MEEKLCEIDGCNTLFFQRLNGIRLCAKHYWQIKNYGKILERTIFDKNEIIYDETNNEYAFIILYNRKSEIVGKTKIDSKNIDFIKNSKWYLRPDGYVATTNYNGKYMYLHKLICNKQDKFYVDHKDRNKLNNTEENLRVADGSENQMNKGIRSNNTSGKVGVHFNNQNGKWCAMICHRKKHINLGYFDTFEEAVKERERAERMYFKDYRAIDEKNIGEI